MSTPHPRDPDAKLAQQCLWRGDAFRIYQLSDGLFQLVQWKDEEANREEPESDDTICLMGATEDLDGSQAKLWDLLYEEIDHLMHANMNDAIKSALASIQQWSLWDDRKQEIR